MRASVVLDTSLLVSGAREREAYKKATKGAFSGRSDYDVSLDDEGIL